MTVTVKSVQRVRPKVADSVRDQALNETACADWSTGSVLAGFGSAAVELLTGSSLLDTMGVAVRLGRQLYGGDAIGLVLTDMDSRPAAQDASDPDAAAADRLQVSLREGPSGQAMARRQPILASDLRSESRWRFWAPLAADLGFRSVLSVPLTDADTRGAMNVYSRATGQFHSADPASTTVFSQLVSVAITVARQHEQLIQAVESRTIVGQAQGILMDRYGINADEAFAVLRRYSSGLNVKLRSIAEGVIADRALPSASSRTVAGPSAPPAPFRPMTARLKNRRDGAH
jgi:transcriptional regulator with GAF, ATPase, and Fis domain